MSSENEKKPFLGSYLSFVDSTRFFTTPFSWLYYVVAVAFLAIPIGILATGIDYGVFKGDYDGKGKIVFAFILTLIAAIAAAIISFVVAWNGKKKISTDKITIEVIIDAVADLQALIIKSQAHFIGVFGFFAGLFALIFGERLLSVLGLGMSLGYGAAGIMIGAVLLGYGMVWFSRLYKFLFEKIARIVVKVIVQIFRFVVLHAIAVIYNFVAHIIRQLFDYIFLAIQAIVDYIVNGLKVVIALVARLGRFLLAYARSPFKNRDYNDAKITFNE